MNIELKNGDILFGDLVCDEGEAIQVSTESVFTHAGIFYLKDKTKNVIEAHGTVTLTPLKEWLKKCQNRVAVARVKPPYEEIAQEAAHRALGFLGRPYNHFYEDTTEKLYCASLIYYAFKLANDDQDFFPMKPMDFSKALNRWKEHFGDRPIPQGKPGLNPGFILKSPKLKIIYDYRYRLSP